MLSCIKAISMCCTLHNLMSLWQSHVSERFNCITYASLHGSI
jgi:hypothetical protein